MLNFNHILPSPLQYRDPQTPIDFVEKLYKGGPFLKTIPHALLEDGIFIGQIGAADTIDDPGDTMTLKNKNVVNFISTLVDSGFESILGYEEVSRGELREPTRRRNIACFFQLS